MKKGFRLKIGDIILMSAVLALSVLLLVSPLLKQRSVSAEIYISETDETRVVSLEDDDEFEITSQGVKLTVLVAEGEISVKYSSCRDSICKNTPPISRTGQTIVCAPAGVIIKIVGEGAVIDGVTG